MLLDIKPLKHKILKILKITAVKFNCAVYVVALLSKKKKLGKRRTEEVDTYHGAAPVQNDIEIKVLNTTCLKRFLIVSHHCQVDHTYIIISWTYLTFHLKFIISCVKTFRFIFKCRFFGVNIICNALRVKPRLVTFCYVYEKSMCFDICKM